MGSIMELPWWEKERLLTEKDRKVVEEQRGLAWTEMDEGAAETEAGRYTLHAMKIRKMCREEFAAGIL